MHINAVRYIKQKISHFICHLMKIFDFAGVLVSLSPVSLGFVLHLESQGKNNVMLQDSFIIKLSSAPPPPPP